MENVSSYHHFVTFISFHWKDSFAGRYITTPGRFLQGNELFFIDQISQFPRDYLLVTISSDFFFSNSEVQRKFTNFGEWFFYVRVLHGAPIFILTTSIIEHRLWVEKMEMIFNGQSHSCLSYHCRRIFRLFRKLLLNRSATSRTDTSVILAVAGRAILKCV